MRRKKQNWRVGDTFVVPLDDTSFAPGHVVAQEPQMLNSVTCAFYDQRISDPSPGVVAACIAPDRLMACLFTTHDLLDQGVWSIVGHQSPAISTELLPFEHTRGSNWVGAKLYGSRNVTEFLKAFHRLAPWDSWADPHYLDRLLIDSSKKPTNVLLSRNA
jgi:hypothetical protein